jgi:hypothetical protein
MWLEAWLTALPQYPGAVGVGQTGVLFQQPLLPPPAPCAEISAPTSAPQGCVTLGVQPAVCPAAGGRGDGAPLPVRARGP